MFSSIADFFMNCKIQILLNGNYYIQIVLAIGNYMNSAKRGPVYGFKLQSLDMVMHLIIYIWPISQNHS